MKDGNLTNSEKKLINVMVGEIFQLAEMEKLDERSIERLERLGVAALKLRAAIEQGEFENDELSTQMCLAIKEALVEGEGLVN